MRIRRRDLAVCVLAVAAPLVGACGGSDDDGSTTATTREPGAPIPVVVDTDLALDDLVALLFLQSSPAVELRAVTVSGTGEVRCPRGLEIARSLLAVTGHDDVPVACGRSDPLEGDHAFPDEWRDAVDAVYGIDLPAPSDDDAGTDTTAVELLTEALGEGGTTLLTLGPLTNVAEAFRAEPDLVDDVESIVVMGGAVDTAGNVFGEGIPPSTAEWNLYVDPTAAAEVVESGAPVVLVGLDATNQVPVTLDFVDLLQANARTDAASLVATLLAGSPMIQAGEAYLWDSLAAAAVVDPTVVTTEEGTIVVVTEEGRDNGRTARRDDGATVEVALGADADAVDALLLRTLAGLEPDEPLAEPAAPVGTAVIRFDGTTCTYEGPASVPAGRMLFTFESTISGAGGAVADLTGELTIEEILQAVVANPDQDPPGIEAITFVDPARETRVDVTAPTMAVACGTEGGLPIPGPTFTVEG